MSIIGYGGCEKKMEKRWGVRCVGENNLSHHFLERRAVYPEPAGKAEGELRGCAQLSHNLTGHDEGGF